MTQCDTSRILLGSLICLPKPALLPGAGTALTQVANMYAVVKTGGKQYKVQAGDVLQIEKVDQELGSEFNIDEILMIGGEKAHVGTPTVKYAKVTAVVTKRAPEAPKG